MNDIEKFSIFLGYKITIYMENGIYTIFSNNDTEDIQEENCVLDDMNRLNFLMKDII